MDGRISVLGVACLATLAGCTQRDPLPFAQIAPADEGSQAAGPGPNAFTAYSKAAADLDGSPGFDTALLLRTSYSPGQRETLKASTKGAIESLRDAVDQPCHIPYFAPDRPEAIRYRAEWRLLSRILCWRIADDCDYQKLDDAIDDTVLATKFGFDLTSGPPRDATLGFVIVDSARKAVVGSLEHMQPRQLQRLAEGVKAAFLERPPISEAAAASADDMLEDVQEVQDCYRDQDYAWIEATLGDQAKEPVQYLVDLHQDPDRKRVEFFEGLASEAKAAGALLLREAGLPLRGRLAIVEPPPAKQRPWKRFSAAFLSVGKPLLAMNDATCARTQLLILESELMAQVRAQGKVPNSLNGFTASLTLDPYSGQPFVYRTDGRDYRIYSVGADLVDDNGDTDESFSKPDLTLEKP